MTRGQDLSFAAVQRIVAEHGRTLSFQHSGDVVYQPDDSASCIVAVYSTEGARARRKPRQNSVVVHPIVDDMGRDGLADGDLVGFVPSEFGSPPRKGEGMIARMGLEVVTAVDLPYEQMAEWYRSLRVLLVPSQDNRETYGRVIVEAASAGVPVAASRLPGPQETMCALRYIAVGDVTAWRRAVDDGRWQDRGEARRRYERAMQRSNREIEQLIGVLERTSGLVV